MASDDRGHMAQNGSARPLWAGRFSAAPEGELERFGASLPFDQRLWKQDIAGSKAHATMLAAQGIISDQDRDAILAGLDDIAKDIEAGSFVFDVDTDEDIHMAIERVLTERIGEAGGRLHTGRSRNDQVALDVRLAAREMAQGLEERATKLATTILTRAQEHTDTIMPGYTHMQPAQPILFAQHLLAWYWMVLRDVKRFRAAGQAANVSPLGAAAFAGTTYPLDRAAVADALDMAGVIPNSMDAVSDRDYAVELVFACALAQAHLSRICEELVVWSTAEFAFVEMDDAHSTGSSIMPQKKNPDFAELVRGKTGRVIGDLTSLLVTIKGIPFAYNKDLQEDKEALFDAVDTLMGSLMAVEGMIATMSVKADRMREAANEGFMAATDLADYLVGKGMPFRNAHEVVGRIVAACVERGCTLGDLTLDELRYYSQLFDADVAGAVDIEQVVRRRTTEGGTGHDAVRAQLELAKQALAELG